MMRTLGFAQSPGVFRILGGVPGVGPLVLFIVSVWMLVAMVIAVRQALDYTTTWARGGRLYRGLGRGHCSCGPAAGLMGPAVVE